MATTTPSRPVYVQQSFLWDVQDSSLFETQDSQKIAGIPSNELDAPASRRISRPSARKPVTVPSHRQSSSVRRGRCEHVGGILASVLEKYGIGIDQLIAEIDGK
jgi:hypothetical protein